MKGLLPRMEARRLKDGYSYRYHPIGQKPIALGRDRVAAIRKVLDMNGRADDSGTFSHLWRLYQESPEWTELAERTRADYLNCWKQLAKYFADMHAGLMTQQRIRQYMRVDRLGKTRANHEAALVSNLLYVAVDYGYIPANPFVKLKWIKRKKRTTLPNTTEIPVFLDWLRAKGPQAKVRAAMAEFAARSGGRRCEFLEATKFQVSGNEVRLIRGKQRDREITDVIEMSDEGIAAIRVVDRTGSEYLFPNQRGRPYTDQGFKSMWSKDKKAAKAKGIITQDFTFHDLRAYYASEHKRTLKLLPDIHSNPATTAAVYDRNKEVRRRGM